MTSLPVLDGERQLQLPHHKSERSLLCREATKRQPVREDNEGGHARQEWADEGCETTRACHYKAPDGAHHGTVYRSGVQTHLNMLLMEA